MSERTPQDVLREAPLDLLAGLDEEDDDEPPRAPKREGLPLSAEEEVKVRAWIAATRIRGIRPMLDRLLATLDAERDKAIAEAPDSPRCDFDCDACKEEPS